MSEILDTSSFMSLISGTNTGDFVFEEFLPLNQCYPDPSQPRYKNLTPEGVADITASFTLTKGKIFQPIVVREFDDDGRHKILMGGRRWLASSLYGNETISALIVKGDLDSALLLQLMENISRKPLDMQEQGHAFIALKAEGKLQQEIADSLGKSNSYISEAIMLAEMENDPKLQFFNELFKSETCDATTLAALLRHARKDLEKTEAAVKWAIENNQLNRKWAKSLKAKDLEEPFEQKIKSLEERKEYEQSNNSGGESPALKDTTKENNNNPEDFKLEQETDGVESPDKNLSPKFDKNASKSTDDALEFEKKKVGTINVTHNGSFARLLLDRVDKEDGFGWILYQSDSEAPDPVRVDLSELSIIFVG